MKNNYQSKAVPRGTRTIWRYLSAFILLFTLSIGNVWAAEETLTWAFSGINTACTDPSGITKSSTSATSTIQSSMAATFSNVKTKSDASSSGYSSRLQATAGTYLGDKSNKQLLADQYVGASFTIPSGYVFKLKSISFPYCAISTGINARLTISDGETDVTPSDGSASSGGIATISYSDATMAKELSGDVTVKIWFWMPSSTSTGKYAGLGDLAITGDLVASGGDPIPVTGITITPSPAAIKVGKTVTLVPTITPSNATDKAVTWAVTSGSSYASVTGAGVVTGLAEGTAVITATAHDGSGVTQTVTVNVSACPTSGTLFSMTVTDPDGTVYTDVTEAAPQLIGATYTGGQAYAASTSTSKRSPKITGSEFDFNVSSGGSVAVKVELDCPLAEGDIITFTSTHDKNFYIRKVVGTDLHTTSSLKLEIPSGSALIGEEVFYIMRANSACSFSKINIVRPVYRTITLEYADGVTPDGSIEVIDGEAATKPADPTWEHHRFAGWYNGSDPYDWSETVGGDLTLTAHWTQLYSVTYAKGEESATGSAPTQDELAAGEKFTVAANTFVFAGHDFSTWNDGANNFDPGMEYTMGSANVTLTAQWVTAATKYAITKGSHANGDFTISPAEQAEGQKVTLVVTPDEDYVFDAWEIVKTEDASATGILVDDNGQFEMPAYAVTVNATFVADARQKVLYVTNTAEATVKANDKLYAALKDIYNVKIVGPTSDADQSGYALVVLHESVGGGDYNKTAVAAAKAGNTPVLNTKSYFYNDGRFGWGTPNAGQSVKGATLNSAYCNIADHPLFSGVTVTDGFFEITDDAAAKCMQPVGSFTSGKEGYTLATTPNADSGNGAAIHELTPAQRGASTGKYLLISVSNAKLDALNANGQKLFQNAAAYLIGSTSWDPIAVPTAAVIEAAPTAAYSKGDNIALSALAAGVSATTTYTWYKGTTLEAAKEAGAIKAAATAAAGGNTYTKNDCVLGDAGIYWCVISNGTGCEASASVEITVVDASYTISFTSAHGTAPSATTGVSYTLPELTASGWAHQGWTASVNVFVDLEEVVAGTLIANGKMAVFGLDVTFTAVWKQEFQVSFNLNGHGMPLIGSQDVVDGELATEPIAPAEIGWDFGGWFTDAACTAGNEWDFANDVVTEETELFAKWTEFTGCTLLYPATSGSALNIDDNVNMQAGSFGASVAVVNMKTAESSIVYNADGLYFNGGDKDVISVTLNNDIAADTKISVTLKSGNTGSRGLNLLNSTGGKVKGGTKLGWDDATVGAVGTFSYTVEAGDGLEGTNVFRLQRNNSVYLQCIKVEGCGAAITYHNLTSAVVPAGKGTVTLGAGSVRVGHTTTAEFSDIDPLYEFVSWSISGEGASIADASANPATITMGTEDAVVTLNLQLIPEKFTVNYYDGETLMGSEEVALNDYPTASEIDTDKRHYIFQGWSDTEDGDVVDLNSITSDVVATISLYAVYTPVVCPVSGTIFSYTPKPNELSSDYQLSGTEEVTIESLGDYATVSGGELYLNNNNSSNRLRILKTTSAISFVGGDNGYIHVLLDCQLKENDIIRFENSERLIIANNASKTGSVNIAKTVHQFVVPAAWEDKDEFFIWRDGTGMNLSSLEVYRPALLTVSFDVLGHGSAPADLTDVLEGSKITAPTAPTDEDYAFIGWYKESSCENEWNFAVDVVSTNTTLFAKWLDKSDATLKSLKYGSDEITLEDGVYEYEIALPAATASVPALTAVTNNPAATAVVTDDDAFDGDGKATSTVEVTPQKEGAAHLTYTVNFTKLAALPQVDVTKSTLWNFSLGGSTTLQNQTDVVLANLPGINNDENFNSQALLGSFNKLEGTYFQGSKLSFTTEVAGKLTISFRGTNDHLRHLQICVGDGETVIADWEYQGSGGSSHQTKSVEVPAGKVTLKAFEGTTPNNARIYNMEYLSLAHQRTSGYNAGDLGTVCLEDATIIDGANLYELKGLEEHGYLAFDEIVSGELEAGKPYLFQVTNPSNISFYKQVGAAHSDDEIATNGMIGTFTGTTLTQGDNNYYYFSGRHIWRVNDFTVDIPLAAHRCYVDMDVLLATPAPSAPAPGRRRVLLGVNGEQVATGMENVESDNVQSTKLLINGQLFILRGEKMYDATGRLVK